LFLGEIRWRKVNTFPVDRLSQQGQLEVTLDSNVIVVICQGRVSTFSKTMHQEKQDIYPISEVSLASLIKREKLTIFLKPS